MFSKYYRGYRYRPSVPEYTTLHVLETMSYLRDKDRRIGWFNRAYQKALTAEMKAKRKGQ